MSIAQTILDQLGGSRFVAMTGAKNFIALESGLQFDIGSGATNKANKVQVHYDRGADLYKLTFLRFSRKTLDCSPIAEPVAGLYAEDLQRVFSEATGFDTHL